MKFFHLQSTRRIQSQILNNKYKKPLLNLNPSKTSWCSQPVLSIGTRRDLHNSSWLSNQSGSIMICPYVLFCTQWCPVSLGVRYAEKNRQENCQVDSTCSRNDIKHTPLITARYGKCGFFWTVNLTMHYNSSLRFLLFCFILLRFHTIVMIHWQQNRTWQRPWRVIPDGD